MKLEKEDTHDSHNSETITLPPIIGEGDYIYSVEKPHNKTDPVTEEKDSQLDSTTRKTVILYENEYALHHNTVSIRVLDKKLLSMNRIFSNCYSPSFLYT